MKDGAHMKGLLGMTVACLLAMGCEANVDCDVREVRGASPVVNGDAGTCEVEWETRARLPAIEPFGGTVQICTNCDVDTCQALGEPCDEYGASCETDGVPGRCSKCCEESIGTLRCARIIEPANDPQCADDISCSLIRH
jgi:hypothetical protein